MISLVPAHRYAVGFDRRRLLGAAAVGALGLSLPEIVQAVESQPSISQSGNNRQRRPAAKRCIYIFLCGGPSQCDLWDQKPEAPDGIRSVFSSIETNVPGIRFGELIPQVARHADKLALIRSLTHGDNGHEGGIARTLLGQLPSSPAQVHASRHDHPGLGAIVHRLHGDRGNLPAWVVLPRPFTTYGPPYKGQSGGFLGSAYDPICLNKEAKGSLSERPVRLDALALPEGVDAGRLAARRVLLSESNGTSPAAIAGSPQGENLVGSYARALDLLGTGAASAAFDLEREPASVRDRYGRNEYGQSFLLARRLVEAGVRTVNVFWTFFDEKGCQFNLWDNHGVASDVCGIDGQLQGVDMLKHAYCCPSFDRSFSALLEDLSQRGLLDETLVAVAGEFGRTPKINATAGRDHWAPCYTQLLAGGGVRGGQVYGASDATGAYVKDLPVSPDDFMATVLDALGLPSETLIHDPLGRPVPISPGTPIRALF